MDYKKVRINWRQAVGELAQHQKLRVMAKHCGVSYDRLRLIQRGTEPTFSEGQDILDLLHEIRPNRVNLVYLDEDNKYE